MRFSYVAIFFLALAQATFALHENKCAISKEISLICPTMDEEVISEHPRLSFAHSQWIWTLEVVDGKAPPGSRAFRKNFIAPYKREPVFATIAFGADDSATLYVNEGRNRYRSRLGPCQELLRPPSTLPQCLCCERHERWEYQQRCRIHVDCRH
ncbi:hypothetical protein GYMLUDRAFT_96470 [Collybiopsis luxurians FD-317 M1]|uniref:Uncharacterized protein n=1 Tax=Collybiopsis luxurians FD-317 M1 TaxID=944289 RepID=A0A0D0BD67_9AGAR|nr:hypothetical protein GYMLUDRAFT_96470 [Collybiopsis luxurians FD-317 M1]